MKKLLFSLLALPLLLVAVPVSASPSVPAECSGMTFARTVVVDDDYSYWYGNNQNELVYVTGEANYIVSKGGADCIVVSGDRNYVKAGNGKDVIVATSRMNKLMGQRGADKLYSYGGWDSLYGGAGVDTCVYDPYQTSAKSCER